MQFSTIFTMDNYYINFVNVLHIICPFFQHPSLCFCFVQLGPDSMTEILLMSLFCNWLLTVVMPSSTLFCKTYLFFLVSESSKVNVVSPGCQYMQYDHLIFTISVTLLSRHSKIKWIPVKTRNLLFYTYIISHNLYIYLNSPK